MKPWTLLFQRAHNGEWGTVEMLVVGEPPPQSMDDPVWRRSALLMVAAGVLSDGDVASFLSAAIDQ